MIKKLNILIIAFLPITLFAQFNLSICAIFKDEASFFKEWIEFHKIQGVEHFYLYNNNSQDNFLEVLTPYIAENTVTLIDWPLTYKEGDAGAWTKVQCKSYMDCLKNYGNENQWIAFIDIDEFLFCKDGIKLPKFLEKYQKYAGVTARWICFGTSFVKKVPKNKLMVETLTLCSDPNDPTNNLKSIVQPQYVVDCETPHTFIYKKGHFDVDEHFRKEPRLHVSHDLIQINHYWTGTEKHFQKKKRARYAAWKRRAYPNFEDMQNRADKYNINENKTIFKFVKKLRHKMGLKKHKQ